MRALLLLLAVGLLLAAPVASAGPGDVTVEVAGHAVHYHDPAPLTCRGGTGADLGPAEAWHGSPGPYVDDCRTHIRVL